MNIVEMIAKVCHEVNRVYCSSVGDNSQVTWDQAPEWQKESARAGVQFALNGSTPEGLHKAWCEFKQNDGWVFGPVKDPEKKTHPCLVDYADLPPEQKVKDYLFQAIVESFKQEVNE